MMKDQDMSRWFRRSLHVAFIANVAFKVWLIRYLMAHLG